MLAFLSNLQYMKPLFFLVLIVNVFCPTVKAQVELVLCSPDERLVVEVSMNQGGQVMYTVRLEGTQLLKPSALGVMTSQGDFSTGLDLIGVSELEFVRDQYETLNAKRRVNTYIAQSRVCRFANAEGKLLDVRFQVSDDGVVFRYEFLPQAGETIRVQEELTTFHFHEGSLAWLQPVAIAKSGWEHTNPSYEEHYQSGIPVGAPEPTDTGWIYPALFQVKDTWLLISETGMDGRYCATRLQADSPDGAYRIGFPDEREVMPDEGLLPQSSTPFHSPWRVIAVGSLATIVESTLGLDVAEQAIDMDEHVIKPGKSAWSWINSKDDFIVYEEQKKYIDFAANMNWQYCLIDVNWDQKIGYEKIKELADYAAKQGVGLHLWYNSAGNWNTVKYTPKDKLLTAESRHAEFSRIREMGIKGVKIDFFAGDGQSVIQYYIDILEDAAKYGLLVNFHGATLPRGWSRTYPHLMTVEAVRGFEMVTFSQDDADRQASLSTILPFTRNAFDPMDFTPMNLNEVYTHVERRTTPAFELATSVLFLSGIQHYAESPEGMAKMPDTVVDFVRSLPDYWDDVRFMSGFPGKDVVIARQAGQQWYVAGINGESVEKNITVDLSQFTGMQSATIITDGEGEAGFAYGTTAISDDLQIALKPNGGFVVVVE